MKTSFEYRLNKYGKEAMTALAFWNQIARVNKGIKAQVAKAISNQFYRGGICEAWLTNPQSAIDWCLKEYNRLGLAPNGISLRRINFKKKLGPGNIALVPTE